MRLYIDSADPHAVRRASEFGVVDGVTTNPTLVAETDRSYRRTVAALRECVDGPIFAQVLAKSVEGIVDQAHGYVEWDPNLVVKIPATAAGFTALDQLRDEGIPAGITVVFTAEQALLAAKNDAIFVAPYVGRIEDPGGDGVAIARAIQAIMDGYGYDTDVLAANARSPEQAGELAAAGVDSITLALAVIDNILTNDRTDSSVEEFREAWSERGTRRLPAGEDRPARRVNGSNRQCFTPPPSRVQ